MYNPDDGSDLTPSLPSPESDVGNHQTPAHPSAETTPAANTVQSNTDMVPSTDDNAPEKPIPQEGPEFWG